MVWKILSALTILCLGGAGYFAWTNKDAVKQERLRGNAAEKNLASARERKKEMDTALAERQAELKTKQGERDKAKAEGEKLVTTVKEKEVELGTSKATLEQKAAQVKSLEDQIREAGDIEALIATVAKLKKDQLEAEAKVANQQQREADMKQQLEAITSQVTSLRETEARGRRGIVAPEFTAKISQYFDAWDFAILNKGNSGGVFANADLEVKRGRNVIARLKVRNVEQNRAVADLVPGTLASGDRIRTGDTVVAAATQTAATPPPPVSKSSAVAPGGTPPAGAPPTPGAPAPMSTDPFGAAPGAPGTAPAPMSSDPFGAPAAPAAPAPGAAPAMGTDPFGAPAAPAAPAPGAAPAMGTDPFGAPAAPAAPAAPGAAPAAPGTPAAPSTADPFATAPAPKA